MNDFLLGIIITLPTILIALTFHEFAHAFVAYKLGDWTGKSEGRLSLNPLVHLDPIGTIALFFFRIGWAKPVPISEYNFKNPVVGTMLTAIAGPVSNLILALVGSGIFFFLNSSNYLVNAFWVYFVFINIALMLFNLLPIPPLDGHKIVRGLLPPNARFYWEQLENYSIFIVIPTLLFLFQTGLLFLAIESIIQHLIPSYTIYL